MTRALGEAGERLWVVAHRGDCAHAPENTLEALAKGHDAGADACEIDVQLSRDGQPVVIHDDSLSRTTDVAVRFGADPRAARGFLVRDFDYAEIRTLDAGSWFLEGVGTERSAHWFGTLPEVSAEDRALFRSGRVRVPHLRECLELVVARAWRINVEIKSAGAFERPALDETLAEIARRAVANRVLISSFDHSVVSQAAASGLGVATGVLSEVLIDRPGRYVKEVVGADTFHLNADLVLADHARSGWDQALADLRARGVPILVYTINEASRAEHARIDGVNGVFTDDPRRLVRFLS